MVYFDLYTQIANYLNVSLTTAIIILTIVGIWSLVWKGFALWKSARKNSLIWFIILLIVNTIGILEILYIYIFSEMKFDERKKSPQSQALHEPGGGSIQDPDTPNSCFGDHDTCRVS